MMYTVFHYVCIEVKLFPIQNLCVCIYCTWILIIDANVKFVLNKNKDRVLKLILSKISRYDADFSDSVVSFILRSSGLNQDR